MSTVGDHKAKEVAPFLKSLRQILDNENPAILRWTVDGKAFEIHDMEAMMRQVLPKYFKHGKYTSFQRQLNYFNFRKWTKSKAVVCTFSNPFFQRDQPALSWRITRKKSLHAVDAKKPASANVAKTSVSAKKTPKTKKITRRAAPKPKPIVIKLPAGEATSPASFPSPTDAFSLANELDLRNVYGEVSDITFHEPLMGSRGDAPLLDDDHSLDWVDVLYSSLEPLLDNAAYPSFRDYAFDYAEL
ncbi:Heat shock factor protein [Phytophthora citrophthora]|uniref:Heat shock factor protein n=1 Tax=Phytophthora citrophthora TaxID=4793 RepID=A0AAD9GI36_9STRA|nr:Heat shock factor protein [Phytophthora citrophthora]